MAAKTNMERLGHFRILNRLGAGGMGEVFRARDERLHRDVAIKILPPAGADNPNSRARLLREARSAAALSHPHICVVYEVGESDGQAWIAMECVPGEPLNVRLSRGRLPPARITQYGLQLADALDHAHKAGIVHRDLKPGNVMVTPEDRLKVLDFGLAKRMLDAESNDPLATTEDQLTLPGALAGTPAYMAPEQLRGYPADARSDIWALGVILHEMATGTRPFGGRTSAELASAILNDSPVPAAAGVPSGLATVIQKCLAKDPEQRYQQAAEVSAALREMTADAGNVTRRPPIRLRPRRPWVLAAAAAIVLVIAMGIMFYRQRGGSPEPSVARAAIDSVAVLPLANLSGDPEQDYLVDGIHASLLGELATIKALRVISRTSVLPFKGNQKPLATVARELNVDGVVEGSVTRAGDQVRVQVQLISPRGDERLLFSNTYEREIGDALRLNGDIALALAREMKVDVTSAEDGRLTRSRENSRESYETYLRAVHSLNQMTEEGFQEALGHLHGAIDKDPADPLLYSGLAFVYSQRAHGPGDPREDFPRAKAAAQRAIRLDPTLADPQHILARIKLYWEWDLKSAGEDLRRSVELNPNLAAAHADYSWWLVLARRYDEAIAEMGRAQAIDPLDPTWPAWEAWIHAWSTKNYDEGIRQARKALSLKPDFHLGWVVLGFAQASKGLYREAVESGSRGAENPGFRFGLGLIHAIGGNQAEARRVAAELAVNPSPMDVWFLAEIYGSIGDRAEAIKWLEKAFEQRFSYVPWILETPSFRSLGDHPRFQEMIRKLGVPLTTGS